MKFPLQYRHLTCLYSKRLIEYTDDSRQEKRCEEKKIKMWTNIKFR